MNAPITIAAAVELSEERRIANARTVKLTKREQQALEELSHGRTNAGLGRALGISEHTAKFHVNALLLKFNARSRHHVIAIAFRAGRLT